MAVNEDHMKAALEYVNGGQMEKDFKSGSRELYVSLEDVYSIPRIGQESQVPIQMLLITTAQVSRSNPGVVERFFVYLCMILSRIAFAIIF